MHIEVTFVCNCLPSPHQAHDRRADVDPHRLSEFRHLGTLFERHVLSARFGMKPFFDKFFSVGRHYYPPYRAVCNTPQNLLQPNKFFGGIIN